MHYNGYYRKKQWVFKERMGEGKVFSSKWVDQNNQNTLQVAMYTPHSETIWKIYLNPDQPHEEIRSALFEKYGKTP